MKKLLTAIVIGLALISCEKEKKECSSAVEKTFDITGFNKITAAETFTITVKQGVAYNIKARGCADDLSDLALTIKPGGFLGIQYNRYQSGRHKVTFEITMPSLNSFNLAGAATGTATGFGGQATFLRTILSGSAHCTIDGLPVKIEADNSGTSVLNLAGTTNELDGSVSGDARLNAYNATTQSADVYTSGTAKAYVMPQQLLVAAATGASRIYYKGNPADKQIAESGTAKVIHE